MFWTGFVFGALTAYGVPIGFAVVCLVWYRVVDWLNAPTRPDEYSRSMEDN